MKPYECYLKSHGQLQIELHARYPLKPGEKKVDYFLDMYIFTPSQLDMNKKHYGVDQFLHDLQCYTRYTHPSLPLARLLDPDCPISPLTKIRKALDIESAYNDDMNADELLYELRTLVNIYRRELREMRNAIRQRIDGGASSEELRQKMEAMLGEEDELLLQVRNLHGRFLDPRIPEMLREGLRNADEALSIKTEKELFRLYHMIENRNDFRDLSGSILARLKAERLDRMQAGYATIISTGTPAENDRFNYYD
ncbi:MAG TPA: hypothetical protein PKK48_06530, partial [Phycisphaerae bacterium]|nr:hypothetical protein [Phycisphaerae bacterium]